MSCLLTVGWDSVEATVQAIKDAGSKDRVKIIIGAGIVSEKVAEDVGADSYARDVMMRVDICKS